MATIKPIEAHSIHQIQSGQVIVDLCSVVKELVENSLDAGATSLEVRFKNNGLDSIEVQDNGTGISPSNYESLALKHFTSKLTRYDDLSSLQTFGFRGEALSSLCALSTLYIVTAMANEAPKGKKLGFDSSGRLEKVAIVAAQKGTTAVVQGLFEQLPVRRKELTKNIKKEYGRVLGLLHSYACICTNVKFTVRSSMANGKNANVFATKANPTTKENIANVYGAKTLSALVPLELQLQFQRAFSQRKKVEGATNEILVRGHISSPVFGEGRQTPDRQMFFVNGRPCGLPQIAKAFNEVYKSFNVSQSPFIFADLRMDTNAYDVNVSPDKRTIILHDSAALVETLKSSLTTLFDQQEQTMPQSHVQTPRLPGYKQLTFARESAADSADSYRPNVEPAFTKQSACQGEDAEGRSLLHDFLRNQTSISEEPDAETCDAASPRSKNQLTKAGVEENIDTHKFDEHDDSADPREFDKSLDHEHAAEIRVRDFNLCIAEQEWKAADKQPVLRLTEKNTDTRSFTPAISLPRTDAIQDAFGRARPTRPPAELATITVGDKTITTMVGSQSHNPEPKRLQTAKNFKTRPAAPASTQAFTQRLRGFAASASSGAQMNTDSSFEMESRDGSQYFAPKDDGSIPENVECLPYSGGETDDAKSNDDHPSDEVGSVTSLTHDTDGEYIDEPEKKALEDATVVELILAAEKKAVSLKVRNARRAGKVLKSRSSKDSMASLQVTVATSIDQVCELMTCWQLVNKKVLKDGIVIDEEGKADDGGDEEERLALIVSKNDFSNMHVVGQFNLGFILAVRAPSVANIGEPNTRSAEELFIVDQHASDEKYNFEKLQEETLVGSQRLVRPKQLDLTAVEEEILIENSLALEKNGFLVSIDTSGNKPIGKRCRLISLPVSKEVTFRLEDLEELLHLLAESPGLSQSSKVARPSTVRKMFAMRACRSSIMIGKSLNETKMRTVISHMGEIDKPWNCPHGRPTMRHLITLNSFRTWQGDGMLEEHDAASVWSRYAQE